MGHTLGCSGAPVRGSECPGCAESGVAESMAAIADPSGHRTPDAASKSDKPIRAPSTPPPPDMAPSFIVAPPTPAETLT